MVPSGISGWPDFGKRAATRGVVIDLLEPRDGELPQAIIGVQWKVGGGDGAPCPTECVALDLSEPEGCDRAARWVAEKTRLDAAGGVLFFIDYPGWRIASTSDFRRFSPNAVNGSRSFCVPTLSQIDLASPPADQQALAAVVMHLAGVANAR